MQKKEIEIRVMNYFTENINLHKQWEIAKQCAREIMNFNFEEVVTGKFEMPSTDEIKTKIAGKVPYEFDPSDFMEKGPLDLSGLDDDLLKETIEKSESIYKKFHDAQTRVIAKAAKKVCDSLNENLKKEIHEIKNKYLS
jgi:hypothetical protein